MRFNVIAVSSLLWIVTVHATPSGNHTCTGVVKHSVTVRVNVTEPVTYRTYTWCLRVPPRCSKYTVQLKDRIKIHTEMHNRTITVCCKGYVEMDYKCVPACPPQTECPNMHCNRTNHCYCTPGYQGLYCNYPCDRGFWGTDCKKPCDCPDGFICHHLTGDCMLDDRPPLTTKSRRTTTTTAATVSPEITITETATTTTAEPSTEPPTTRTTTTTTQATTVTTSTTIPTTRSITYRVITTPSTVLATTPTESTTESAVETKLYSTSTTYRPVSVHKAYEDASSQKNNDFTTTEWSTMNTRQTTLTKDLLPTLTTVTSSATQPTTSDRIPLSSATSEIYFKNVEFFTSAATTSKEEENFQATMKSVTLDPMFTSDPVSVRTTSEGIPTGTSSTSTTTRTVDSALPTVSSIVTVTSPSSTEYTLSTEITSPSTLNLTSRKTDSITELSSTTATDTSTPSKSSSTSINPSNTPPSTTAQSTTQENITLTSIAESTPHNISHIEMISANTAPPVPDKSTTFSYDNNFNINTKADFTSPKLQTGFTTAQNNYETLSVNNNSKKDFEESKMDETSESEAKVLLTDKGATSSTMATSPNVLPTFDITERTVILKTVATDLTTISMPTINLTSKKTFEEDNDSTTESILTVTDKKSVLLEENRLSKVSTNEESNMERNEMNTTVSSHMFSTTPTLSQSTKSTERPTSPFGHLSTTLVTEPESLTESAVKREETVFTNNKTVSPIESFKGHIYKVTTDNLPIEGTTENVKADETLKLSNVVRKHYTNGTHFISTVNEDSTNVGPSYFDMGNSVTEMKSKQRPEVTTTLSSKEEASVNNLWVTTNSRPAHTWYSHIKEYQKKTKNKEEMKLMKASSHLDMLVVTDKYDISEESNIIDSMQTTYTERGSKSNSGAPTFVNEGTNVASPYLRHGHIKYNLSSALAEEVQAGRDNQSFFTFYSTSTLISGIALILLISTSTALWFCHRRNREPSTLRGPCIMAYGPPDEFTLNPLMYETVYPLEPLEGEQCDDPEIFFCPTFTNNYAERINRELSELNYDHPRSSICEPLYAEIRY